MADYTIIADVSSYIVKTLREKMCPEPIPSPNNIFSGIAGCGLYRRSVSL